MTEQDKVNYFNEEIGNLNETDHVQCDICKNRGYYYILRNDEILSVTCSCMNKRAISRAIDKSGLKDNFERYTFDNYTIKESWQQYAKDKAIEYANTHHSEWFVIVGQVGSGKSHLCTAIVSELINQGNDFRYLAFARDMPRLQQRLRSGYMDVKEKAEEEIEALKKVKVLYIDDYLKTNNVDNIFELIDYRYSRNDLITIISSEKSYDEQRKIDEALASRIYERANGYYVKIAKDENKNYRL